MSCRVKFLFVLSGFVKSGAVAEKAAEKGHKKCQSENKWSVSHQPAAAWQALSDTTKNIFPVNQHRSNNTVYKQGNKDLWLTLMRGQIQCLWCVFVLLLQMCVRPFSALMWARKPKAVRCKLGCCVCGRRVRYFRTEVFCVRRSRSLPWSGFPWQHLLLLRFREAVAPTCKI